METRNRIEKKGWPDIMAGPFGITDIKAEAVARLPKGCEGGGCGQPTDDLLSAIRTGIIGTVNGKTAEE